MRRWIAACSACLLLGGCALPLPLQVASWAADIFSVVATDKTITDHGLSAVAGKDCALMRAVTAEDRTVCRANDFDPVDAPIQTASNSDTGNSDTGNSGGEVANGFAEQLPSAEELAAFETAAGASELSTRPVEQTLQASPVTWHPLPVRKPSVRRPSVVKPDLNAQAIFRATLSTDMGRLVRTKVRHVPVRQVTFAQLTVDAPKNVDRLGADPIPGIYLAVASARGEQRARALMNTHNSLGPIVIQANLKRGAKQVYRIVVGPLADGASWQAEVKRLAKTGVKNTWAIRVAPGDWTVRAVSTPPTLAKDTQSTEPQLGDQAFRHPQQGPGHVLGSRDWPGLHRLIGGTGQVELAENVTD